jgi:hypothetical protein
MTFTVDFTTVSTAGLESSPVAAALAGLRANEARYFKNKYDHVFTVEPAGDAKATIDWVHRILKEERDIIIASRPLEATEFQVENIRMAYVFYESGLSINVMYTVDDAKKRRSASSSPKGWKSPRSSLRGLSSRGRNRSWPEPFAVPTSTSRTSTDPPDRFSEACSCCRRSYVFRVLSSTSASGPPSSWVAPSSRAADRAWCICGAASSPSMLRVIAVPARRQVLRQPATSHGGDRWSHHERSRVVRWRSALTVLTIGPFG